MPFPVAVRTLCFAIIALLLAVPPAAADASVDIERQCASKGRAGVYYKDTQNPGQDYKIICLEELMRMSCQPLAMLRNYLYYTAGYCFRTPNYQRLFPKPGCDPNGNEAIVKSSPKIGEMAFLIRGIEIRKDCIDPYAIHDPWVSQR
ncbi:MAG TPA: YARHG domain-containing protein [Hyphomicrobiales bacterium]|nr:YARHG domain-containing protein [Hyphomicrobiales bacterium]